MSIQERENVLEKHTGQGLFESTVRIDTVERTEISQLFFYFFVGIIFVFRNVVTCKLLRFLTETLALETLI
jgi:hypothetical protein